MVLGKETMNRVLEPSLYFRLENGREIKSLAELNDALKSMDDTMFSKHVTSSKNDFSNWIRDVFHEHNLAEKIRKAARKEIVGILSGEIENKGNRHDENENKISEMSRQIEQIEDKITGIGEDESIDDALRRLQALYKQKKENESPPTIIMHDKISDTESIIHLGEEPSAERGEVEGHIIEEERTAGVRLEDNTLNHERYDITHEHKRPHPSTKDTGENKARKEETGAHTETRHKEIVNEIDMHELKHLRKENHNLKEKISEMKEKAEELERLQGDFNRKLVKMHDHIRHLTEEIDTKNEALLKIKSEKNKSSENDLILVRLKADNDGKEHDIALLKKECSSLKNEVERLRRESRILEQENLTLSEEIDSHRKRAKAAELKRQPADEGRSLKDIEQREKALAAKEAETEEARRTLKKRREDIEKKEKEFEITRDEYMKNIKSLVESKKAMSRQEKEIEKMNARLREKDIVLREREKDVESRESDIRKKASRYEREMLELKKEIREIMR